MNFSSALVRLKMGEKIKRAHWGGYWFLSKKPQVFEQLEYEFERHYSFKNDLIVAVLKEGGGCAPAQAYQEDLLADDWKAFD